MTTAKTIIEKALSYLYTYDNGTNEVIFNDRYYEKHVSGDPYPWCCAFLKGYTTNAIARILTADGIPSPGGKPTWHGGVVKSILTNEKFRGDALLQIFFILWI